MKVLNLLCDTASPGRSIHYVHNQITRQLERRGHEVDTLYICGEPLSDDVTDQRYLRFDFSDLKKPRQRPLRYRKILERLHDEISAGAYAAVVADGMFSMNALLCLEKRLPSSIHYLCVIHGVVNLWKRKLPSVYRAIKKGFSANWDFVSVSDSSAEHLQSLHPVLEGRVMVIENCIDVPALQRELLPREQSLSRFGIDAGRCVYGAIGRLAPEKDYETLLRAFAAMCTATDVLLLIGEGKERLRLEALTAELGISERVVFAGYHERARRYLCAFDVFVMSSITEGSPVALIEAMAASRPVVCADIDALRSIGSEDVPRFACGDARALSACLVHLREMTTQQRGAVGDRLRELVEKRFSPSIFGEKYSALLTGRHHVEA